MIADATAAERAAWLEARRLGIGASDAAAVLGVSPWKGPLALYAEKLGLVDEDAERAELERMEWGLALEPVIAVRFQRDTGRTIEDPGPYTLWRHRVVKWMLATLDRVQHAPDKDGPGVLEIKNVGRYNRDEWADGDPPLHYQVQVQHQLAVTGYTWGSLAVLFGGNEFAWLDLERNDDFIAAMVEREADFWRRVEAHDPPPPDATESCRDVLGKLFPREVGGKVVALPPEAAEWDRLRIEAMDAEERCKKTRLAAENYLKAALGDAEAGILSDGTRYSLKAQTRKAYMVEESTFRVLRRKAAR
jgi:putative phage-type endonuclease